MATPGLISLATILYVGFTPAAGHRAWERWTRHHGHTWDIIHENLYLEYLLAHAARADVVGSDAVDAAWFASLTRCGMNHAFQEAIMDPIFSESRLTASCGFWIRATIARRYETRKYNLAAAQRGHPGRQCEGRRG